MNTWTSFLTLTGKGFAWLFAWSWQSLVLLASVWLGLKLLRTKSPALRHQIWLIALATVALLPFLAIVAKQLPLSQSNSRTLHYVTAISDSANFAISGTASPTEPVIKKADFTTTTPISKNPIPAWPPVRQFAWMTMFLLWAAGVFVGLFRFWRQYKTLKQLRVNSQPISPTELDCAECAPDLLNVGTSISLSAEISSPILVGVRRPMILLPADITDWTGADERQAMIRHELAHVERRDHWINLLPTLLHIVFFFHPMVRYACRQLGLERELACDDQVVSLGITAETYAESILKVAERSLAQSWSPRGAHQLALFSAKHILERRIEMILNKDRARVIARQWKYLLLPAAMIALVAWLLIPAGSAKPGLAHPQTGSADSKFQLVKSLGDNKAYNQLIEMALHNPDAELRRLAAIKITEIEGDGSTDAMLELYRKTDDLEVKQMIVETFARTSEIEPLTKIALTDSSPEMRARALSRIKWLKENSESADVRAWNVPGLQEQLNTLQDQPPPPPPPPPTEEMTVEAGKPLNPLRWQRDKNSIFALLREAVSANINHDTAFFERVLDDDYVSTGPSGETMNKAQVIADVKRLDYTVKKFEFDDLRISSFDGGAFATFLGTVYFQTNGVDSTVQYRYTINFIERNGELKIAADHLSRKL
ncbi:MAG: DUF4440 domain-containing protein [Acidobacteria bacterium]|nr:DUF4440 domain-containing protein [Acidobacteriota bacterium]